MIAEKEFKFDARYDRLGYIKFTTLDCHVCKKKDTEGISIDSSMGEYGPGCICFECIHVESEILIDEEPWTSDPKGFCTCFCNGPKGTGERYRECDCEGPS